MIRVFKGELIEDGIKGINYITYIFKNENNLEDRDSYVMCSGRMEEWWLHKGDRGYIRVEETLEGEEYMKRNGEKGTHMTNGVWLLEFKDSN